MDAQNAVPLPAPEKVGNTEHASLGANNPVPSTTPAAQSGTPGKEVVYLHGTRFFMVATLCVPFNDFSITFHLHGQLFVLI